MCPRSPFTCCEFAKTICRVCSSSSTLNMGLQYSPVLSMTTCVQPQSANHWRICVNAAFVVPYLRIWACASPLAGPFSTQTTINFLPTSMPAQHSNTAGIIFASCPGRRPTLMQLYKLFREPKLILGCVPHRPDQVHPRGFCHHYAERSLRPGSTSLTPFASRCTHRNFHVLRVAVTAMRGSSV